MASKNFQKKRVTITQQGKCIIYILNTNHKLYRNIKEVKVIIITIIFYNIFVYIFLVYISIYNIYSILVLVCYKFYDSIIKIVSHEKCT